MPYYYTEVHDINIGTTILHLPSSYYFISLVICGDSIKVCYRINLGDTDRTPRELRLVPNGQLIEVSSSISMKGSVVLNGLIYHLVEVY